jgi:hypothetical protein
LPGSKRRQDGRSKDLVRVFEIIASLFRPYAENPACQLGQVQERDHVAPRLVRPMNLERTSMIMECFEVWTSKSCIGKSTQTVQSVRNSTRRLRCIKRRGDW